MSVIGSVIERTPGVTSQTPFPGSADPKTGFPAAAHRSQRQRKSAFRQNAEAARTPTRDAAIPIVQPTPMPSLEISKPGWEKGEPWRATMEEDNARRVANMTPQEREEELQALRAKAGDLSELKDVLQRARERRTQSESKRPTSPTVEEVSDEDNKPSSPPPLEPLSPSIKPVRNPPHRVASPPRPILSRRGSVAGSRTGTSTPSVRFADVTSKDVFTYPSAPTSPKRGVLAIEAPPVEGAEDLPKVMWKGKLASSEGETGKEDVPVHPLAQVISTRSPSPPNLKLSTSPPSSQPPNPTGGVSFPTLSPLDPFAPSPSVEQIRLTYFPNEPSGAPSREWLADLPEIPDTPTTSEYAATAETSEIEARFNLAGTPVPAEKARDVGVWEGLHHNARMGAGYTLGELLHLARSTAPMQRAMALDALARLVGRVGRGELGAWFSRGGGDVGKDQGRKGEEKMDVDQVGDEEPLNQSSTPPPNEGSTPVSKRTAPHSVIPASELRKRVIESATAALGERGAVGTRAVDCIYATLVVWDRDILDRAEGVEISLVPNGESSSAHILPSNYTSPGTEGEKSVVDELNLEVILENVSRQVGAGALPRSVLGRLLEVVVRLARHSRAYATAVLETGELVPGLMRVFVLGSGSGGPYPEEGEQPDALAIRLLGVLARSSRQNAHSLLGPADALLRFVAVLPPPDRSTDLLVATLDLYTILGRYGMYAHIATTAADFFTALSTHARTRRDAQLLKSWIRLRTVWVACATDPHGTTPAHEILWSQVEGWGWGEDALALCLDPNLKDMGVLEEMLNGLAVWVEGVSVNGVRAGETERSEAKEAIRADGRVVEIVKAAVERIGKALEGEVDAGVVCAALRLDLALLPPESEGAYSSPLDLPLEEIGQLAERLLVHPIWDRVYASSGANPYAYARLGDLTLVLGYYLLLARRIGVLERLDWLRLTFATLQRLQPGHAEVAARLIRDIGGVVVEQRSFNEISGHLQPSSWTALLPFLLHELQPDSELLVSPLWPSSISLPHCTTQVLPSLPALRGKSYGLPMPNDWTLLPLGHLLRSGTSPVFKSLPEGWDSDEVDVVRSVLALTSVQQTVISDSESLCTSGAEIVFGCMRVFMLEHGQPHDDSSSEIFRDPTVEHLMSNLLSSVSLGSTTRGHRSIEPSPLEAAAAAHLAGQPFYQFYTDLVGLYDAVSFAHPLFARILLAPLGVNYATDYRRLFWGDYGHILRTVRTELPDVPTGTLQEWLFPSETDGEMIGWYLKALMKGGVFGFLRFIVVHHLAMSLWPDLSENESKDVERTRMIIGAMVHQAGPALLSAVVLYEQSPDKIIVYPECYEGRGLDQEKRRKRLEWAVSLCGERVRARLDHVFGV
ncbi:hypothetical protein BDV93DRAFT_608166 [Ceratobasidium sp. AG-I]|nr:hypothetical protein BDV93DRAFT_608166 [Ceratobasidium sp. AG-I]